jgi:hypothetical protein
MQQAYEMQQAYDIKRVNQKTFDGTMTYVCPEETKVKTSCLECGYCFEGRRNDVTFLEHNGD